MLIRIVQLLVKTEQLDLVYDSSFEDLYSKKDEIGVMSRALGTTRKAMRELIEKIKDTTLVIEENAKELSALLGETTNTIEGVAKAVDDMVQGSVELAQNTLLSAERLDMLSKEIEEVDNSSLQIKNYIEESKKAKDKGVEVVKNLQCAVTCNEDVTKCVGEKVFIIWSEDPRKTGLIVDGECWGMFDLLTKRKLNAPREGN